MFLSSVVLPMSPIMDSLRKWFYKPRRDDTSYLAQFFYADEALNLVAAELDSFDGRKDPERCSTLVNHLRQCQDKVLTICNRIMDEMIPHERADRDFRVKFPDDVMQDNLAGQLWFGAECLAAGSSIMNRETESGAMRPLATALTKALETVRGLLREAALRPLPPAPMPDPQTERLLEALKAFDHLLAEFELAYVSAMVPVKTVQEYELQQCVVVLFSETLNRALDMGLLSQEQVDQCDPALMFTIPRLAIVAGLLVYPHGPLSLSSPHNMSDMFRPFRTLLMKIRELLWTLNNAELLSLEKMLCSSEEPLTSCPAPSLSPDLSREELEEEEGDEWTGGEVSESDTVMERKCSDVSGASEHQAEGPPDEEDVQGAVRPSALPHLVLLNSVEAETGSLTSPQDSGLGTAVQSNSDHSLSDHSAEVKEGASPAHVPSVPSCQEAPSTSGETWTLQVIPCECSFSKCSEWKESSLYAETRARTCQRNNSILVGASSPEDRTKRRSLETFCRSSKTILVDEEEVNLNNNFKKDVASKNLTNVVVSDGGEGDVLPEVFARRSKYADNWDNLSTMASSNAQEIRREVALRDNEGVASSFSSSGSSVKSTSSPISNSMSSSDTSSYNSDCHDEMEVALAVKAAEFSCSREARARFKSSEDLVHRLFVCISGVADQLQTNFAGDLRNILKAVFLINASDRGEFETPEDEGEECCERGEEAVAGVMWGTSDSDLAVEPAPAWVPDQAAPSCMACHAPFTVVRRRHHCRNCGKVFCGRCSSNSVPLPRYGHVKPVRVCNRCFIYQVTPFTVDQNIATAN